MPTGIILASAAIGGLFTFILGAVLGARLSRNVCGCGHHLAYHDPASGKCADQVYQKQNHNSASRQWVLCACMQYVPRRGDVRSPSPSTQAGS